MGWHNFKIIDLNAVSRAGNKKRVYWIAHDGRQFAMSRDLTKLAELSGECIEAVKQFMVTK